MILRAYRRWGEACVEKLSGDFAFAIWDGPKQKLFCARDHFGVKPFYYAVLGNLLLFSNTLDCLRQHPAVSGKLNGQAIGDFLLFGYNGEARTTTFADIQRLPPAHTLACAGGNWRSARYWTLSVTGEIRYRDGAQYLNHFRELFSDAVNDRLRASARAAIYMSGGIDSPSIAAAASGRLGQHQPATALRAYCLVSNHPADHERHYSTLAAQSLAIPIEHRAVDPYGLFERCHEPALCRPEPYDWPLVALNHDSLSEIAKFSRMVLYGWAKLMGELTLRAFYRDWGMKSACCRYFTVYGERGHENHAVIAMIAKAFVRQEPFEVWGDGTQVRNWTYIGDIVDGTLGAAEKIDDATAVNLGTMERITVRDAVRLVMQYSGHEAKIAWRRDMPVGPLNRVADNRLAKKLLDWEPRTKFADGLRRTLDWYFASKDVNEIRRTLNQRLTER